MSNLPWYQRPIFRTFSFWACVVGCWLDVSLSYICTKIPELHRWVGYWLFFASVFALGAVMHWAADHYLRKERASTKK